MTITTSFNDNYIYMFIAIRQARPELKSNSEIAQIAMRKLYEELVKPENRRTAQDALVVLPSQHNIDSKFIFIEDGDNKYQERYCFEKFIGCNY